MAQSSSTSQEQQDLFNDPNAELIDPSTRGTQSTSDQIPKDQTSSKLKRTACVLCRKRKLKCDGARPACATCARLGHDCIYDEVRKKSGPKRGYVKALEARLAQVETMLTNTGDEPKPKGGARRKDFATSMQDLSTIGMEDPVDLSSMEHPEASRLNAFANSGAGQQLPQVGADLFGTGSGSFDDNFSFDMIALGLEEPLPTPEATDELNEIFFEQVNRTLPMIHKARFYAAMNLAPNARPPVCLRYAMWSHCAANCDRYQNLHPQFYQRARKYLELDEMRGFGQSVVTVAHCQAWVLVAMYEFKNMFFPRAWMSTGRAIRLAQMLGLHRLDGSALDVKMTIQPPKDWTDREERRRTFWMVFWEDRCASIGTGWPMSFDEKDILTNLPSRDEDFQNSQASKTQSLPDALTSLDRNVSSISGTILMATLFGRNLTHLHRPDPDDNEYDLNGKFWQRHRSIDAILLNIKLALPEHLRLPLGMHDPNVIFLNMCLHGSAICLHQAAIFKAEKHKLPPNVAGESKMRCIAAASEIASIMRTVSHMDLAPMNPFTAFCLYVAARVFVQFLRARPHEQQVSSSLHFLMTAMHAIARKNPLTESFIAQLELDLESAGLQNLSNKSGLEAVIKQGVPEYAQASNVNQKVQCPGTDTGRNWGDGAKASSQGPETNINRQSPSSHPSSLGGPGIMRGSPQSFNIAIHRREPGSVQPDANNSGRFIHTNHKGFVFESLTDDRSQDPQQGQTTDPMDCSPDPSGSSSNRAGHTPSSNAGNTVFTPPSMYSDEAARSQQGDPSRQSSQGPQQQTDITPENSFSPFSKNSNQPFAPGVFPGGTQNMSLEEFAAANDFAAVAGQFPDFLNATSAGSGYAWDQSSSDNAGTSTGTGLTPGPGAVDPEEFERVMESMGMGLGASGANPGDPIFGGGLGNGVGDIWNVGDSNNESNRSGFNPRG